MLSLLPAAIRADETFSVTRNSAITFGHGDGDTFGLDEVQTDAVAVLVRPQGEACTLRFLLLRGEKLRLRAAGTQGEPLMCEATLMSAEGEEARFTARCSEQATGASAPKCPRPTSAEIPKK
jgi:SOS-response transcriptional repressor LexA